MSTNNNEDKIKSTELVDVKTIGDSLGLNTRPDIRNIESMAESMTRHIRPDLRNLESIEESMRLNNRIDIRNIGSIVESMTRYMGPSFGNLGNIAESMNMNIKPDISKLQNVGGWMSNSSKYDFNNLANTMKLIIEEPKFHMDKLVKALELINQINPIENNNIESLEEELTTEIKEINWQDYKLNIETLDQTIEELKNKKIGIGFSKLSKSVQFIIISIYSLISLIADITQIAEYTEDRVIPAVQSFKTNELEGKFQSEKTGLDWLNNELKKDVSDQIVSNFRIVAKEELIVREGKKKDSRIVGKLEKGYVVQILEKGKNWCYVFYTDYKSR